MLEADRPPLRVMIVDDHPIWREALERDLRTAGLDVVGTAGDGEQALRRMAAARPDVVVLDLRLPVLDGVETTREIAARHPGVRVLVLSASGEEGDVLAAIKAGATGYLVKSASREELLEAVGRTAAGDAVFTPGLAGLVLGEFRRMIGRPGSGRRQRPAAHGARDRDPAARGQGSVEPADRRAARAARTGRCRTTPRTCWPSCSCTIASS